MFREEKELLLVKYYEACYFHELSYLNWEKDRGNALESVREMREDELDRWTHESDALRDALESVYALTGRGRSEDRAWMKQVMHDLWMMAKFDAGGTKGKKMSMKAVREWLADRGLKDDADWRRA